MPPQEYRGCDVLKAPLALALVLALAGDEAPALRLSKVGHVKKSIVHALVDDRQTSKNGLSTKDSG